jgi:hypothetical protein
MLEKPEEGDHVKPMYPEEKIHGHVIESRCIFVRHCVRYVQEDQHKLVLKRIEIIKAMNHIHNSKLH